MQDVNEFAGDTGKIAVTLPKSIQQLLAVQGNEGLKDRCGISDNDMRKGYYQFAPTQFNVWGALNNRESIFMKDIHPDWEHKRKGKYVTIRPLRVYNTHSFDYHMRQLGGYRGDFKIYNSVFTVDWNQIGLPPTNLFDSETWKKYRKHVTEKWDSAKIGYDFIIDVDGDEELGLEASFQQSKAWAMQVHNYFMSKEIDHTVNFSGRNFHVRVPYSFVDFPWDEFYKLSPTIAQSIAKELKIPFSKGKGIDSSVYDKRRITKTLYSVSDMRIVLPVTEWQLDVFTLEDYELFNAMKQIKFMNRKCEFRYGGDTTEALRKLVA